MTGDARRQPDGEDHGDGREPRDEVSFVPDLHDGELRRVLEIASSAGEDVGRAREALLALARALESRYRELHRLDRIALHINEGLLLDDILDSVYEDFRSVIPYSRIGCSLLEQDGKVVTSRWARSDLPLVYLPRGYSALLEGSSLADILKTGRPRILNDLEEYLRHKPQSASTRLVVAEGIRSSLTCPLVANGVPVGFIFFSSCERNAYQDVHGEVYQRIASQLSVIVEKGRMVSELAAQKAAIERQNEELRSLSELKSKQLGMAAHDLRNPIGTIQMAASLLLEEYDHLSDAEHRKVLTDVLGQTRHMLAVLNDLLDVSEIESGTVRLAVEPVEVGAFLSEAVERHARIAVAKRTAVLFGGAPAGTVCADPQRLRQIVDNLISNAVKYSPPSSTVRVHAERGAGLWRVSVEDEGPGITEADRQRLFQHFARLSAQPTGGEKSTGLGLAITRRAVRAHGGEIHVRSEPGRGATFVVSLPDGLPRPVPAGHVPGRAGQSRPMSVRTGPESSPGETR